MGLQKVHQHVYPASERGSAHHGRAVFTHCLHASAHNGLALARIIPFAKGHAAVIVVGSGEHHYGVHTVALLGEQTSCLTVQVAHLMAVDAIHQRHYTEHVGKKLPVAAGGAHVMRVGDGVSKECHARHRLSDRLPPSEPAPRKANAGTGMSCASSMSVAMR